MERANQNEYTALYNSKTKDIDRNLKKFISAKRQTVQKRKQGSKQF